MTKLVRIYRKGGKVMQDCDVYIGSSCTIGGWSLVQSKWHNPFAVTQCGSPEEACRRYETYLRNKSSLLAQLHELDGKVLGCWCKNTDTVSDNPSCHGEVLMKLLEEYKTQKLQEPK
jgi:hypothetical protein